MPDSSLLLLVIGGTIGCAVAFFALGSRAFHVRIAKGEMKSDAPVAPR